MEGPKKIKLLWVSDAVAATGFARVAHSVLNELYKLDIYDIHLLGINYFGDPHGYDYNIYPASAFGGHQLGFHRIENMIKFIEPDVIFLLNDIWVLAQYLEMIPEDIPVVMYTPIDSECLKPEWLKQVFERNVILIVYTDFARKVVKDSYSLMEAFVIPHGVDSEKFYPINKFDARAQLNELGDDDWIVLNANRNQPRKRIDSTIRAFAEFAKDKPKNVKLYLHMGVNDAGWDIQDLWKRYDIEERIVITNPLLGPQNPVPDETLNFVYNACDVGINTSLGEGWGLPNFEHAAVKKVQIVPNSSACAEIFADGRGLLIDVYDQYMTSIGGINTDSRLIKESSATEKLQWAYEHPEECAKMAEKMYEYMQRDEFQWPNIARRFNEVLIIASRTKKVT